MSHIDREQNARLNPTTKGKTLTFSPMYKVCPPSVDALKSSLYFRRRLEQVESSGYM